MLVHDSSMIRRVRKNKEPAKEENPSQAPQRLGRESSVDSLDGLISSNTEEFEAKEFDIFDDKSPHFSPEEVEKRVNAFVEQRLARWNIALSSIAEFHLKEAHKKED